MASGWRAGMRRRRSSAMVLKAAVFLVGAACIAVGLVLIVLPGPLTIPPVLLGLYLWSTEFTWAERLRDAAMAKAQVVREGARRRRSVPPK